MRAEPGEELASVFSPPVARPAPREWSAHKSIIDASMIASMSSGHSRSRAMPGIQDIASTVTGPDAVLYAISVAFSADDRNYGPLIKCYVSVLRRLADDIQNAWNELEW